MIFFLSDFILASFTNISSFLIILSWLKNEGFYYGLEGLVLSLIYHNYLYLGVLILMYFFNKILKLKVTNLKNYYLFFIVNYIIFNLLMGVITGGVINDFLFNLAFNLLLIYPCYKLIFPIIKLNR